MSTADDAAYWHACWKRAASERAAAVARAVAAEAEVERLRAHLHLAGTARQSEAVLRHRAEAKIAAVEAECDRMEATTDMGDYGAGLLAAAEWVRAAIATKVES